MEDKQPSKQQIEARKKVLLGEFSKAIEAEKSKYGPGYEQREFTFARPEHIQLNQQQTIIALAERAVQDLLNIQVLPRVGIQPSSDIKITYDLTVGRFVVWIPKKPSGAKNSKSNPSKISKK